jgi:hypothetical protein
MEAPMSSGAAFSEADAAAGAAAGFGALVATRIYGTTGSQCQIFGKCVFDTILRLLARRTAAATGFFSSQSSVGQAPASAGRNGMPFDFSPQRIFIRDIYPRQGPPAMLGNGRDMPKRSANELP